MTRSLCLLRLLLLTVCSPAFADLPPWQTGTQGSFVTSLATDAQGRVWAGTEGQGVWVASPNAPEKGWAQYGQKDGLGEDDVTALVCDAKGHLWAGQRNRGVSVLSGQFWKDYDAVSGPLGSHVFALAVSPKDGDVWMATDAGLARYSLDKGLWRYETRTDGLPADQIDALTFDSQGTLYAGTQCDGLAVGSAADDYASWRHQSGPKMPPPSPAGTGLPDSRINAVLATHDGSVYAGTPSGLAGSQDGGKTWKYLRGIDWLAKAQGQTRSAPAGLAPSENPTLAEDAVTALAEDGAGRLWIGHGALGVEVVDPAHPGHAPLQVFSEPSADDVHALLASTGSPVLIGGYGSGLALALSGDPVPAAPPKPPAALSSLPFRAAAPTVAELKSLLAAVSAAAPVRKPGDGAFLSDDWQTQGDWVGRYGHQYAELCGISDTNDPFDDTAAQATGFDADEGIGPHHKGYDGVYTYIANLDTLDQRFSYSPALGHRREAEVNDGSWDGGKYPATYEGPDLWVTFTVPTGTHRASFYFVNNDGHDTANRSRDYLLELKPDKPTLDAEDQAPALASARVASFYGGVYKQFIVQGPATFHLKIGRCYSSCTKLQGIFLDKISDAPTAAAGVQTGDALLTAAGHPLPDPDSLDQTVQSLRVGDSLPLTLKRGTKTLTLIAVLIARPAGYGMSIRAVSALPPAFAAYGPPALPPATATESDLLTAARALWSALDRALGRQGGEKEQTRGRILAYRAALASQAPAALLANWRWHLGLWSDADRADFDKAMREASKTAPPSVPQ